MSATLTAGSTTKRRPAPLASYPEIHGRVGWETPNALSWLSRGYPAALRIEAETEKGDAVGYYMVHLERDAQDRLVGVTLYKELDGAGVDGQPDGCVKHSIDASFGARYTAWTCSCNDFRYRSHKREGGVHCKHTKGVYRALVRVGIIDE
jgi:hypothetical protein